MKPLCRAGRSIQSLVHGYASRASWLPPLVARVSIGWLFVVTGWGKLHNLPKVIEFFTELGIPAPHLQAPFVASTELVCGFLILIGLFTRFACVPLTISMIVAIVTAKRSEIHALDDLFGFEEYLFIVAFLFLIVHGAGKISLDAVLNRRCRG